MVDVLPKDPIVLLVYADRVPDRARLAARVVHNRVKIGDLAQTVAAELKGGGHEAKAPLTDVECGPAVVISGGIPVRHNHFREGEPVRYLPQPPAVAEPHLVQHQPLAMVKSHAQLPVLPGQQPAIEVERDTFGLADLEGLHFAQRHRDVLRQVLAHDLGQGRRRTG